MSHWKAALVLREKETLSVNNWLGKEGKHGFELDEGYTAVMTGTVPALRVDTASASVNLGGAAATFEITLKANIVSS